MNRNIATCPRGHPYDEQNTYWYDGKRQCKQCRSDRSKAQNAGRPKKTDVRKGRTLEERFWLKVNKAGPVPTYRPDLGPCWLWEGSSNLGYGTISRGRRGEGMARAHRLSFAWANGPIDDDKELDHLCRVTLCVNPAHLEAVTSRENTLRGFAPSAEAARRDHCVHGHPYTPENTYVHEGARHCRTCMRASNRRWAARQ